MFGLYRAWVLKSNITPFDAENWKPKFNIKTFKTDREYRAAIVDAVRINGEHFVDHPDIVEIAYNVKEVKL
jgi:hypothetical protein